MSDSFTKKSHQYLKSSQNDLQMIFTKIKALEEINKRVLSYLSADMKKYCQVANFTSKGLIILAANGSVATQLRFQTGELLQKFKSDPILQKYPTIQCKVRPSSPLSTPSKTTSSRQAAKLSSETAGFIRDIANSLEDPKLKAALERIAEHTDE